jgi:hypothetical protein
MLLLDAPPCTLNAHCVSSRCAAADPTAVWVSTIAVEPICEVSLPCTALLVICVVLLLTHLCFQ